MSIKTEKYLEDIKSFKVHPNQYASFRPIMIFVFSGIEPEGGLNDLAYSCDTIAESDNLIAMLRATGGKYWVKGDTIQVFSANTRGLICTMVIMED